MTMLSKRVNDIIFIGIIIVVAVSIVFMRFVLINQIDENIDQLRRRNDELIQEIAVLRGNINRYKDIPAPTQVELHQAVPRNFDRNQLSLFITAEAIRAGITNEPEFNRTINVIATPAVPTTDNPDFQRLVNNFDLYIVNLRYEANSLDELYQFLDLLENAEQVFVIRTVSYQTPTDSGRIPIDLTFYAVYYKSTGTS